MRYPDWPNRLAIAIESFRTRTFVWGVNDCCLMAADGVLAITGVDIAVNYRGIYSTQEEALAIIAASGSMALLVTQACELHGWRRTIPKLARRGDLVLCELSYQDWPALGICAGSDVILPAANGITTFPTIDGTLAWRIT